ncbi:hypothetical protein FRC07_004990 [Ceratobasidium sp. 392]|nr:hypothetical protein FRC07_004990 [Ceratobasidium sp. 392]
MTLHLPSLEQLELSGAFIILSPLFTKSPLPRLNYLLLDFVGTSIDIPQQLFDFSLISTALTRVYVGSMCFSPDLSGSARWEKAFRSLRFLKALILAEIEWREVVVALTQLGKIPHEPLRVELKEIWDIDMDQFNQLLDEFDNSLVVEVVDCVVGKSGRCVSIQKQFLYDTRSLSSFDYNPNQTRTMPLLFGRRNLRLLYSILKALKSAAAKVKIRN